MDGKLMPSNPKFKGVGATKKSNPFPQGKQKARVFTEPQSMLVSRDSGKVHGTNLTPKEYAKKNFPSAETTKKELKKTYDKEVPYYDSRGPSTLSQLKGKEGKFIKIDDNLRNYHNKRVVATAGKGSKDKDKYSNLDYSKGSKLANLRKKEVNMKDHYSWRDSFELTENQANRIKLQQQRQKQNQGRAAQQFSVLKPNQFKVEFLVVVKICLVNLNLLLYKQNNQLLNQNQPHNKHKHHLHHNQNLK